MARLIQLGIDIAVYASSTDEEKARMVWPLYTFSEDEEERRELWITAAYPFVEIEQNPIEEEARLEVLQRLSETED